MLETRGGRLSRGSLSFPRLKVSVLARLRNMIFENLKIPAHSRNVMTMVQAPLQSDDSPIFFVGGFYRSFAESQSGAGTMSHPSSDAEEPAYLRNDPGLACLASQLRRIKAQIMCLERLK